MGGLKVNDPAWLHVATLAHVKTPHCWQLYCYLKAAKGKFSIGGYAAFAGLEIRHVERMMAVFEAEGLTQPPQASVAAPKGTRLPADFTMPAEWILWAQTERSWTRDVAETEAASFIDHWHAKTGADAVKLSWIATWRNWVRAPWKKNGERAPAKTENDPVEWLAFCKGQVAHWSKMRDTAKIKHWRMALQMAEEKLSASRQTVATPHALAARSLPLE